MTLDIHIYGMSHVWDPGDDIGCRWDDPELGFRFEVDSPILSDRDANAGTLTALVTTYSAVRAAKTGVP